jgi:dTDP-4-dehydrorhamnose 3,5-epimerase
MRFRDTAVPGVLVVEPDVHRDDRGFFLETYHREKYRQGGLDAVFVQDNHSRSVALTLRGLHAQLRRPQGKLVRAVRGEIFDVAVDIRRGSRTFGRWVGVTLSADNKRQLWVPPGFAHAFYVTSEVAEVVYKVTAYYSPEHDRGIRWNDPAIGIDWPLINGAEPLLSGKDSAAPLLAQAETCV